MRALLLAALAVLPGCGPPTPVEHCAGVALLTYAKVRDWDGLFGHVATEKVCIVAIKPLER